jgi:hypothetical protein
MVSRFYHFKIPHRMMAQQTICYFLLFLLYYAQAFRKDIRVRIKEEPEI